MIKFIKSIFERLFGNRWICEYCGKIEYAIHRPYCKPCCHIHRKDVKMFWIKK